jgi:NitT/TauT family transport system ATP-binding protein
LPAESLSVLRTLPNPPGAEKTVATKQVEMRGVTKTYRSVRGAFTALSDINLEVRAGEFVSIVGPSGCGKSTILKCVAGLEPVSSGEIRVTGKQVTSPPDDLGVVFQRDLLFDWRNVLDNVLITAEFLHLPRRDFVKRAEELLALFGLHGFENRFPWELSGGMRQRVAICRALLANPKFLLMDEPFGALDALTRDELNIELQDMWLSDKKTVIFITHGISEAVFLSDRVVIMDRNPGRIVEEMAIDLPRPRPLAIRETADFARYSGRIRQIMTDIGALRAH